MWNDGAKKYLTGFSPTKEGYHFKKKSRVNSISLN